MTHPRAAQIDWRQVACFLLEREARPVVILDRRAEVVGVNAAFTDLVGRSAAAIVGRSWAVASGSGPGRAPTQALRAAFAGESRALELLATSDRGESLVLVADPHALGSGPGQLLVLVVRAWSTVPSADSRRGECGYDISISDFGRLRANADGLEGLCHKALHGLAVPCPGCPAPTAMARPGSHLGVVRSAGPGTLRIVGAKRTGPDAIHMQSMVATPELLSKLLRARGAELADTAKLTQREREVLDLMLTGTSPGDVATALGISVSTAKFHQANVLAKLGAESRLDLLRLIY